MYYCDMYICATGKVALNVGEKRIFSPRTMYPGRKDLFIGLTIKHKTPEPRRIRRLGGSRFVGRFDSGVCRSYVRFRQICTVKTEVGKH
jgi:hypothetical protein